MGTITIIVSKTGETTLEVNGVQNEGCLDLTKGIEEMLGSAKNRIKKSEAYVAVGTVETVSQ